MRTDGAEYENDLAEEEPSTTHNLLFSRKEEEQWMRLLIVKS